MRSPDKREQQVPRFDGILIALVVVLCLVSLLAWLGPAVPGVADARALDIAINVAAVLIGAAVAILGWVRWRDTGEPLAVYECSAFVALTVINSMIVGIVIAGREAEFGLSADAPGEAPVYLWTVTRFVAGFLLVTGAVRSLRGERARIPAPILVIAPSVVLVAIGILLFGREAHLPPVSAPTFSTGPGVGLSLTSTVVGALQISIFATFIVAAILLRRLYVRRRRVSHAFLAAGLLVAAFSQLHFLLAPVVAIGVVTSTDALRLAFYFVLFIGIQAERSSDLRELRAANAELERLRDLDAVNATLAERTRLAREIHDGLAQDLWYAKLRQGKLIADGGMSGEGGVVAREVLGAIESGLAEARQAVMALRVNPNASDNLNDVLRSYAEDFADRFGIRTELSETASLSALTPRTQAEILRIVQEALNNVRRHADATVVHIRTEQDGERARIQVVDNGRGFDLGAVSRDRYGLRSMRERAELVGGTLDVRSAPSEGTTVTIEIALNGSREVRAS